MLETGRMHTQGGGGGSNRCNGLLGLEEPSSDPGPHSYPLFVPISQLPRHLGPCEPR